MVVKMSRFPVIIVLNLIFIWDGHQCIVLGTDVVRIYIKHFLLIQCVSKKCSDENGKGKSGSKPDFIDIKPLMSGSKQTIFSLGKSC